MEIHVTKNCTWTYKNILKTEVEGEIEIKKGGERGSPIQWFAPQMLD